MTLATVPLRSNSAIVGSEKFTPLFSRNLNLSFVGGLEYPLFLVAKWNPDWSEGETPGVAAAAATIQTTATSIIFRVDGNIERTVSIASGKTVGDVIDEINAPASNGSVYWLAGVADVDPSRSFTTGIGVAAEQNAMVGYDAEVAVSVDATALQTAYVSMGADRARRGVGQQRLPSYIDTAYDYPVATYGRAGGIRAQAGEDLLPSRAGKFTTRSRTAAEANPANFDFRTIVNGVNQFLVMLADPDVVLEIWETGGANPLWSTTTPKLVRDIPVPNIVVRGPAFLVSYGATLTDITDGVIGIKGAIRVA